MTHPRQLEDTLDCGTPLETWEAMVKHMRDRARASEEIALGLEREAKDATDRAAEFHVAAQEFHSLANALNDAPVTFAALETPSPPDQEGRPHYGLMVTTGRVAPSDRISAKQDLPEESSK